MFPCVLILMNNQNYVVLSSHKIQYLVLWYFYTNHFLLLYLILNRFIHIFLVLYIMDILRDTINQLDSKELDEFQYFITRFRKKEDRKDLQLVKLFSEHDELKSKEYTHALYGSHRLNTYQALRKRLLKQVSIFINQKYMLEDQSSTAQISGYMAIIRFMMDRNNDFLAWTFLKKAEELAVSSENYGLLNNIFNLQLEYSESKM